MKSVIAAIVAGIVIFMWGFISWTILPWTSTDVHVFTDQAQVMENLLDNSPDSGIYYIPADEADYSPDGPVAFVNVLKTGYGVGMSGMMIKGLLGNIVMAFLAILLLTKTSGLGYMQKVGFVTLTGLLIGVSANLPYWNWFGFPTGYSAVMLVDSVVAWFFAGLVIAKLVPNN